MAHTSKTGREDGRREDVVIDIRAGLCEPDCETRFVAACEPGTQGTYVGPHPTLPEWHLVEVAHMGRRLVAPLHAAQFTRQSAKVQQ